MEVGFARRARDLLEASGMEVVYREGDHGHWIEPEDVAAAAGWLTAVLPSA
jgi:predicted esterase